MTAGLAALVLAAVALTGCGSEVTVRVLVEETPQVVEEIPERVTEDETPTLDDLSEASISFRKFLCGIDEDVDAADFTAAEIECVATRGQDGPVPVDGTRQ